MEINENLKADLNVSVKTKEKSINTISAKYLQSKDFEPIEFLVDTLLPQGLAILSAPPKYGKSWLVLDLCICISKGLPFLGFNTIKSDCLYLALEDGERRLKERLNKLLKDEIAPDNFNFVTEIPGLSSGLIGYLESYLNENPNTKLIVIDTLQKVRENAYTSQNLYSGDYKDMGTIKKLADKYNICILLVHHLRKAKDDGDVFNMMSGSTAIAGASDNMYVLNRNNRMDSETKLTMSGRDIIKNELILKFNEDTCKWSLIGSNEEIKKSKKLEEYIKDPIVYVIRKLMEKNNIWHGTAQELLNICLEGDKNIYYNPATLSKHLRIIKELLEEQDCIQYTPPPENGRNGRREHTFKVIQ